MPLLELGDLAGRLDLSEGASEGASVGASEGASEGEGRAAAQDAAAAGEAAAAGGTAAGAALSGRTARGVVYREEILRHVRQQVAECSRPLLSPCESSEYF